MTTLDLSTTELAKERTDLALIRNRLAADRTLMAWIRTAISLISFGFAIPKFLEYVPPRGVPAQGPRNLGVSLILLGTAGLMAASIQHWRLLRILESGLPTRPWSLALTIASIVSLIGLLAFLSVLSKAGPF